MLERTVGRNCHVLHVIDRAEKLTFCFTILEMDSSIFQLGHFHYLEKLDI